MTSKPPAGIQRQPQSSLSGTGMIQRPAPQRTLSQQHPSSAAGKKPDNFVDLTLEGAETVRYGPSRIGGSRLKLELAKESKNVSALIEAPRTTEATPKAEPMRGRPRLHFDEHRHQLQDVDDTSLVLSIQRVENASGQISMPLPRRPVQDALPFARGQRAAPANGAKKEVRPKPYVLGVPSAAPHYLTNSYADFFPWGGDHPEDQFNDHVIRHGFFDKSHAIQNETASARLSIFPTLKNKSSLQTLSNLFIGVIRQRRAHSQITSPPTFKPPPRVTLTDTKKETWLKDLANPTIPLRRLSRTIPHGIRGKQLLEQCLSKKIPTSRAAWLAKCVGANEIRAFKRKGVTGAFAMGGESKWIRDWTMFVEQFVESVVSSCGENDWRAKILYSIRLAAHLYSEHLLDRDHYMDWLSTSLEGCPLAKAPIWLLITQIHWDDLLRYRKYGSRLVAALCSHLQSANEDPDRDLLTPLIERLASLLDGLMNTHSESFVSPKVWVKYKATLGSSILRESAEESSAYQSIDQRNEKLMVPDVKMDLSPRQAVIGLLDNCLSSPYPVDLARECKDTMPHLPTLARTILDWVTSPYRPDLVKVYVGARLLRTLSKSDIDVNELILDYLASGHDDRSLCKSSTYHLASELTRSGHFSVSRYIQWLISRGGIRRPADVAKDGPCASRLLAELPMHGSPESLLRLRQTMLSRASFSVDQENEEIEAQMRRVEEDLNNPEDSQEKVMTGQDLHFTEDVAPPRSRLSQTIKSEVGLWIRKKVLSHVVLHPTPTNAWKGDKPDEVRLMITLNEFNVVREVLEDIGDLTMLADTLKIIIPSDDLKILASVADTLNFHVEEFGAIGALNDLFDKLLARFLSMRDENEPTVFLAALANLAARLPGSELIAQQLSQELLRINRKGAIDACSPVSEHMAEVLQSSESEFSDEVEKVLASGTYMETSDLKRLFEVIISRIEASWVKSLRQQRNCVVLLSRLRNFDMKQFDLLMEAWLRRFLQNPNSPTMTDALGPLISADCLDFEKVVAISGSILENITDSGNPAISSKISFETLGLLLGTSNERSVMSTNDAYYLNIRRLRLQKDHPCNALSVIRRAIELGRMPHNQKQDSVLSLCRSKQMRKFLRHAVLSDLDAVVQEIVVPLAKNHSPESSKLLKSLTEGLLDPGVGSKALERTVAYRIEHTLCLADDLTLPFCQLELQLIFATEAREWAILDSSDTGCLEAFERAVDSAVASNNKSWTSIIPLLDNQIAHHLCQRAERLFLQLVPSVKAEELDDLLAKENDDVAKKLLFVIHATTYSMQASQNSQLASQIVEKLNDTWQITSHGSAESRSSVINQWLPLMLDFITLRVSIFDNSKSSSELRSRAILSLTALLLELPTYASRLLLQQIFDVALLLVDDLPEETRMNCVRSLKDKTFDRLIEYIFSYSAPPTDWLHLSQNSKTTPYTLRRWEILSEPTPIIGENDTSLSLTLFKARKS